MDPAAAQDVGETPVVSYTDPPYNAAMANGYRTKAKLGGKVDYKVLLRDIVRAGATLGPDEQARLRQINERLSALSAQSCVSE